MADPERIVEHAIDLIRKVTSDGSQRGSRRRRKRQRQRQLLRRVLKTALWMMIATFVIIPGMIATGLLFGPRGVEGVIAAPLALMLTWAAIVYLNFGRKPKPPSVRAALGPGQLAALPAQTEDYLDGVRNKLPWAAQRQLDSIGLKLEVLTPQLQTLDPQTPAGVEVRRLLGEELPELVRGYERVPPALAKQPLYGGPSPEAQLIEGLETIDKQIVRMHERLAADDLKALATHQRYLELKYDNKDGEDDK